MTLKLYLLRHAQAESSFDMEDKERPLSKHGILQAEALSAYLKEIDSALCSGAIRTMQTLSKAQENGATINEVKVIDSLYNASAGDLLKTIQQVEDAKSILIVAHNPGIHQLAKVLCGSGVEAQVTQLELFYSPATLSVFECDIDSWKNIAPKSNKLVALIQND